MPLHVVKRKDREHLYLRGTVRGIHVYETTGTDSPEAAEAIRIKREGKLLERSIFGPGATVTFAEAAVSYLSAGGEARFLGECDEETGEWTLIIGELGRTRLLNIDQARIDEVAGKLYPGVAPGTLKRQVYSPVCAVLNHAARKKWCPRPAIRHPSVPEPVTTYSTPARLAQLLPHCRSRNMRLFVLMLVYTGERLEKLVFVDWDRNIDLSRRTITFPKTKNGKMRTVAIHDALLIELAKIPEHRRRGRVFHWKHKTSVHSPLKSACRRAGIDYLPPHQQGRHTFGSWLRIYAKRDLKGIMKDGGWEDARSTMRYLHVDPGESEAAVAMLPSVPDACPDVFAARKKKAV